MKSSFDVVIVGSGAGGASLAQRLAPTGKSILLLERGEHLP
ncbi:MAG: NAD(P)-binding protein, partial [Caulobacteraceae bacterium]